MGFLLNRIEVRAEKDLRKYDCSLSDSLEEHSEKDDYFSKIFWNADYEYQ